MPSRRVLSLTRSSVAFEGATRIHGPTLAARLQPVLAEGLEPGETLPDLALLVKLFGRAIDRNSRKLNSADAANDESYRLDRGWRTRRDALKAEVRTCLLELRLMLRGAYGTFMGDQILGMTGRLSRDPNHLLNQARSSLSGLAGLETGFWQAPLRQGVTLDVAVLSGRLKTASDALASAQHEAVGARRHRIRKWADQHESLAKHRADVDNFTRVLESLLVAAQMPLVAERVRLSRRRRHAEDRDDAADPDTAAEPASAELAEES